MFKRSLLNAQNGLSMRMRTRLANKIQFRGASNSPRTTSSKVMDDKMQYKWFLLVAAFGTMVYINIVKRIQEQDHSSNIERYKKEFTPEEWEKYVAQIERKSLLLSHDEECYMIPVTNGVNKDSKIIKHVIDKLGKQVSVLDLNELVKFQLETPQAKYNIVLNDNLESTNSKANGFQYSFTYKLRSGLFTQLINDGIKAIKEEHPEMGRFLILNYPPDIKEAVKFEQNVTTNDFVIKLNKNDDSNIIQYFDTVDKSLFIKDMKQLEPLKIDIEIPASAPKVTKRVEPQYQKPVCLADLVPDEKSSSLHKAQYKLRQLREPIRLYGETDEDIINRLKSLQK